MVLLPRAVCAGVAPAGLKNKGHENQFPHDLEGAENPSLCGIFCAAPSGTPPLKALQPFQGLPPSFSVGCTADLVQARDG